MRVWHALVAIWTTFFALLLVAAQVPASSAMSNLASWAKLLRLPKLPQLLTKATDATATWVSSFALVVACMYYAIRFYETRVSRRQLYQRALSALGRRKSQASEKQPALSQLQRPLMPSPGSLEPNIGARDAYFMILEDSVWKRQQQATTLVTQHVRRDWLEFRLHKEIHVALRNGQIAAWGEQCLQGMVSTPEKPIPADVWDKAELVFDPSPTLVRTSAYLKGRVTWEKGSSIWNGVRFCREQFFRQFPLVSVTSQRDVAQQLDNLCAAAWPSETG